MPDTLAPQNPGVAVAPQDAPKPPPVPATEPQEREAAELASRLAAAKGARPRGRPRKDGIPAGMAPNSQTKRARQDQRGPIRPSPGQGPHGQPGTPPAVGVEVVGPSVDPAVLRPVVKAGYQFADRIVSGRIFAAIRRIGGDRGIAEQFAREAAVDPAALEAIADYGSQCLAQIFDALGLSGDYACWVGLALFVGGDVKRKDNVLKKVAELVRMKIEAEQGGAKPASNGAPTATSRPQA